MNATIEARVVALMQRARKALRIYASVERTPGDSITAEFVELQAREWRSANERLLHRLSGIVEQGLSGITVARVAAIHAEFAGESAATRVEYDQLILRANDSLARTNFVQASLETRSLVGMKAKVEALLAIEQELVGVLKGFRSPDLRAGVAGREVSNEVNPALTHHLSSEVLGARLRSASARKLPLQSEGGIPNATPVGDEGVAATATPQRGRVLPFRSG